MAKPFFLPYFDENEIFILSKSYQKKAMLVSVTLFRTVPASRPPVFVKPFSHLFIRSNPLYFQSPSNRHNLHYANKWFGKFLGRHDHKS